MYTVGIFPAIPITGKHTTGKWAGRVDSTQNTSECSRCTNKNTCYKSPSVMRKCWDKSHWKSDLPPTLFKQTWRKQWVNTISSWPAPSKTERGQQCNSTTRQHQFFFRFQGHVHIHITLQGWQNTLLISQQSNSGQNQDSRFCKAPACLLHKHRTNRKGSLHHLSFTFLSL